MKDDDAIPLEPVTDEATEARIVAWVLGEASAFEITELERLCAGKPELEIFRRRMLALQGLLGDVSSNTDEAEWKLPAVKRERVMATFGGEADDTAAIFQEKRVSRTGLRVMLGIAACLLVTFIVMRLVSPQGMRKLAAASGDEERYVTASAASERESVDELRKMVKEQEARVLEQRQELSNVTRSKDIIYRGGEKTQSLKGEKKDDAIQRGADTKDYVAAKQNFETELAKLQEMKRKLGAKSAVPATPAKRSVRTASELADSVDDLSLARTEGLRAGDAAIRDENIDGVLNHPSRASGGMQLAESDELEGMKKLQSDHAPRARIVTGSGQAPADLAMGDHDQLAKSTDELSSAKKPASQSGQADVVRRNLYIGEGNFNLGKYDEAKKSYEEALKADPRNGAARRGLERIAGAKSDYYRAAYDHTRSELLAEVDKAWELSVPETKEKDGAGRAPGQPRSDAAGIGKEQAGAAADAPVDGFAMADPATPVAAADPAAPAAAFGQNEFGDRSEMTANRSSFGAGGALGAGEESILVKPSEGAPKVELEILDFLKMGEGVGQDNAPPPPASAPEPAITAAPAADPFAADTGNVAKLELGAQAMKQMEEMPAEPLAEAQRIAFDEEVIAADEPFSTFSLNVSDVSFQLAKAALERGERPAPESIKVEQFYNAVDYGDAAPSSGEPVAGVVEQSVHPVIPGRNLVRMGVRTAAAGRSAAQPLRLTLLVDQSGSMVREDRKAAMEQAVAGLGQLLTEADRISVIGFSRTSRLIAEDLPGNKISELGALVNPEASEGGTNLEEALRLSEVIAGRHKLEGAQNRVVLFTDGAANLGDADPARLAERVKAMRQAGIAFDVAGIGAEDLNDRLLAELARNGNGRYYVAADNLAAQLAGAFRPAAEDVKVQVRFNPQRVAGYRLIGFEESRLKTEDFRNDAIDAAELAAEEAAVALYQVEVLPGGTGEIGEMSVRFREAGTGNTVERNWTIPYDAATPAFDKATPSMKIAGLSMLAAEKLKGGPLADAINFRELAGPLADARRYYKDSNKVADMARVIELLAK